MPDDRDKSTDEDSDMSSLFEEMFGCFQFFLIQKKIFSEFSDERFPSIISDCIRYQRSDDASQSTDDDHEMETKLLCRHQQSCQWHDRFTRYRKDHTLHHHSDEDRDISGMLDKSSDIGR